jgi:serine/threonine-protein kinase
VHLDVNPRNVVRLSGGAGRPAWKLVEFGPAREQGAPAGEPHPSSALRYLAPEQIGGRVADARADVYGLAATLYVALTGREPFADVPAAALATEVATHLPIAPRRIVDAAEDVELVLRAGLAKGPADRFASAREFCAAFLSALDGRLAPGTTD